MLIWRKFWGGKPESILRFIIEAQVPIEETLLFERGSLERERERAVPFLKRRGPYGLSVRAFVRDRRIAGGEGRGGNL